jgi:hypothetical protein
MNVLKVRLGIGVALSFAGVPLGMYMNYMLPSLGWSPIVMTLSVLLLVRYDRLFSGRLIKPNRLFLVIFLFQLLMLGYGIFSESMTWQYITFHLYVIALLGALCTNDKNLANFDQAILWTFIVSGACSVLGAGLLWKGLIVGQEAWELRQDNEKYALEIFTASYAALVNIASALYLSYDRYKYIKWIAYPLVIASAYIVIFGGKRTPLIILLAILVVYLVKHKRARASKLLRYAVTGCAAVAALYAGNDSFHAQIDETFQNTLAGIANIFGNTSALDSSGSAIARYESRAFAYGYIHDNFSIINYLFGGGYMVKWLDNPLLQSYLDMGVPGFFGYLFIVILYPTVFFLKRNHGGPVLFAGSICTYAVLSCINSGNPYQYIKYTPVVLLAFFASQNRANSGVKLSPRSSF